MSGSVDQYLIRVPAHQHVPRDAIGLFLTDVMLVNAPSVWGNRYTLAMIYLAAHEIEMTPGYGSFGVEETSPLQSQRDGDLQRQYAQAMGQGESDLAAYLKLTIYGRKFLALRDGVAGMLPIVAVPRQHNALGGTGSSSVLP